jgi:hypothetical protein
VVMQQASGFIRANSRAPTSLRDSGVSGQLIETKSERFKSSSSRPFPRRVPSPRRRRDRDHIIENYFCLIKDWRRIATRYDEVARNFLAAAALVCVFYWINL